MAKQPHADSDHPQLHRVAMIAFAGAELLDVVGPLEAFASADALAVRGETYAVTIVAREVGALPSASGLMIHATADFTATDDADTILVAGGAGIEAASQDPALLAALRRATGAGRRVGSVCTGAFALAAAGLLDGRRAVTHWNACARLAARYPAVKVEEDPIFLVDRGIWTSAGVTSGIDMALAMIERDHGPKLAVRTAQELVMFRRRPGGQSQFSVELAAEATGSPPMRALQDWILAHLADDLSVEALAAQAAMSPRNFARVFQRETGMTPARFVERARLQRARELLETSTRDLETIAASCGYRSADVLARAMLRRLNANPSDYRRRFAAIWKKETTNMPAEMDIAALARQRTLAVAILLFPEVEVLDFAGPFEVFSVASRIARGAAHPPFRVSTVAAQRMPVAARHGLPVIANFGFAEQPVVDLLIVPGGIVDQPLADPATLAWLQKASQQAALTASVCTGAFLLAKLGLLAGRTVTTHWEDIPELRATYPDLNVVEDVAYVDEGEIVTSAGISAGIDMSLHLVGRVLGRAAAQATARQMQYTWGPAVAA